MRIGMVVAAAPERVDGWAKRMNATARRWNKIVDRWNVAVERRTKKL